METFSSFFSLVAYFFQQQDEYTCSQATVEENVELWQRQKTSELSAWRMMYPNWTPLVAYALQFLAGGGMATQFHDFVPLVSQDEEHNCWTWKGPEYTNDKQILPLCNHWLETLSQAMCLPTPPPVDDIRKTIDTTWTDFIVRQTTPEEKEQFRVQERERYKAPHLPFIFNTHDYQSIVGPVKGVFSVKEAGAKAREHVMLISDRPAYVTILSLVKDSVARLPNGEGTRADVCTLLKDSQFLNPEASDSQIHTVVSGALDRLHAEKDPCVRFDSARKLWIYLHRNRSVEEFKRIHQISAAAAAAKKQQSQSKTKTAKQVS